MTTQNNTTLVRTLYDLYNNRQSDTDWLTKSIASIAEDCEVLNAPLGMTIRGPNGYIQFVLGWVDAFPDSSVKITNLYPKKDRVVVEFIGCGTQDGPLHGPDGDIPATGRRVELRFRNEHRITNGKISSIHQYYDVVGLMQQLGVIAADAKRKRIGILLVDLGKVNETALKFLVLQLNGLQHTFEYEFLPLPKKDKFFKGDRFLRTLSKNWFLRILSKARVNREELRHEIPEFLVRYSQYLEQRNKDFKVLEPQNDNFILITMAKFSDNFYSMREKQLKILALGDWKRNMAPPSLLEFILTLIVRQSVAFLSQPPDESVHLGTKGCLCDVAPFLNEVRYKVLTGFVCGYCRHLLEAAGFPGLADELVLILGKKWLGKSNEPETPAGIAANLGYDLFITKGERTTWWEKILITLQDEGIKQLVAIVGAVVIAALLLWLNLKK